MSAGPELSSVATRLDEMTEVVARIAEELSGTERDDIAADLFEVERAMRTGSRRLGKIVGRLI